MRVFAEMRGRRDHIDFQAAEKLHALGTDRTEVHFDALLLPLAQFGDEPAEFVDVETTAETAVGGHHDIAHALAPAARPETDAGIPDWR